MNILYPSCDDRIIKVRTVDWSYFKLSFRFNKKGIICTLHLHPAFAPCICIFEGTKQVPCECGDESDPLAEFPVNNHVQVMVVLLYLTAHQLATRVLYVRVVRKRHPRAAVVPWWEGRESGLIVIVIINRIVESLQILRESRDRWLKIQRENLHFPSEI